MRTHRGAGHHLPRISEAAQAATTFFGVSIPPCYGSQFISHDLELWADANDVTLDFFRVVLPYLFKSNSISSIFSSSRIIRASAEAAA